MLFQHHLISFKNGLHFEFFWKCKCLRPWWAWHRETRIKRQYSKMKLRNGFHAIIHNINECTMIEVCLVEREWKFIVGVHDDKQQRCSVRSLGRWGRGGAAMVLLHGWLQSIDWRGAYGRKGSGQHFFLFHVTSLYLMCSLFLFFFTSERGHVPLSTPRLLHHKL